MTTKRLKPDAKYAVQDWNEFVKCIAEETEVDDNLTFAEREKRRAELEADPVKWIIYFFPKTAKYPFAQFHKDFIKRIIANDDWYEVISWARELAKSSTVRMVVLYLILTGKLKNILLISATQDSACRLLRPFRGHLEANRRIQYFYGDQAGVKWSEDELVTRKGVSIRALGFGNAPRGTINDDVRPDCVIPDDFDTDEDCRNSETINNKWNWFEKAVYFTRSWSEPLRTIWCGNIIAKDCCITRAGAKARELGRREKPAGHWDIINIRMVDVRHPDLKNDFLYGVSVWPDKNSEERIDLVLAQVSVSAGQQECFNNPVVEGSYFKEIKWGAIPPIRKFPFLVSYGDPAPSNKVANKKGVKRMGSFKANFLMGVLDNTLYVITGYLDHVKQDEFVNWYYYQKDYVAERAQIYNSIENNKLQDSFYEQVFVPLFLKKATEKGYMIAISPDLRDKPDKFVRIEGNLEPVHRAGRMIFNIAEKDNPHMQRLEEQFLLFDDGLPAPADGPDCIEGGYYICQQKMMAVRAGSWVAGKRPVNKKRF